jgi:hypothetical protein
LAAARKNAHNEKLLKDHFDAYDEVVKRYGMTEEDTWNFDETGYRPHPIFERLLLLEKSWKDNK